ncbi:hypothetical protein C8R43DRAFT_984562 [Mycena crocata]|nr:hypothetical protein C8R43DRAFT_984562 [Mycena crocata]
MPTDVSLPGSVPATRSVTGEDVRKALENGVNPFTGRPHSERYRTLLKSRMELPLYAQMDEFYEMFNKNQVIIVAGETGCGKTTQ